jgi:glycosyltransferase involved in cell wall biosynthesis
MTSPKVSVVIPCRNEARYVRRVLESVLQAEVPAGGMEVLVADGMSTDGTREILQTFVDQHDNVRIIDNPAKITPTGLNAAIRAARGDVIVRLDAHTEYDSHYIAKCANWLESSDADNVGGRLRVLPTDDTFFGRAIAQSIAHPFGSGNARHKTARIEKPEYVDTVPFGCYRRSLFDRIGFFREDLARSQDMEFNIRLRARGGKILLVPDISCNYLARTDLRRVIPYYFSNGFWAVFPLKFGVVAVKLRHMVPFFFVAGIFASALLAIRWPIAAWTLLGILAAYFTCATVAAAHVAMRERKLAYLFTMQPAFLLLHFVMGLGSGYAWMCMLLEWSLPAIFRKETPTARV